MPKGRQIPRPKNTKINIDSRYAVVITNTNHVLVRKKMKNEEIADEILQDEEQATDKETAADYVPIGYFSSVENAVKRYIEIMENDGNDISSLNEYIAKIKDIKNTAAKNASLLMTGKATATERFLLVTSDADGIRSEQFDDADDAVDKMKEELKRSLDDEYKNIVDECEGTAEYKTFTLDTENMTAVFKADGVQWSVIKVTL